MTEGLVKDSLGNTPPGDSVSGKEGNQMGDSVVSEKVSMVPVIELAETNVSSSSVKERIAVFDASISSALKSSGMPAALKPAHCFVTNTSCHMEMDAVVQILNLHPAYSPAYTVATLHSTISWPAILGVHLHAKIVAFGFGCFLSHQQQHCRLLCQTFIIKKPSAGVFATIT